MIRPTEPLQWDENNPDSGATGAPDYFDPGDCSDAEAHEAHMVMNGDCPWCGAWDKSKWG